MLKLKRGRPKSIATNEHDNVGFDTVVLERFGASGPGWQARMNAALDECLKTHTPDEPKT